MSSESDKQPESGTRLTAVEIHDNILEPAEKEIERPAAAMLGNAIGGVLLVALLNYGQVAAEKAERAE